MKMLIVFDDMIPDIKRLIKSFNPWLKNYLLDAGN